jgi:sugar lactone lactonase YvrE
MFNASWFRPANKRPRPKTRLAVERLEARDCPSGSYLLVSSYKTDNVLRYDADTGAFVDEFIPQREGRLNQPWGVVIGPEDRDVYVSTGHFQGPGQNKSVLRYDGDTGAFLDDLIKRGQLIAPYAVTFGPDGNLYVGDRDQHQGRIARFDATTGAYLNDFVPASSGGLGNPSAHVFGPSGRSPGKLDLYVSDDFTGSILRYDGATGDFLGTFVPNGSGGLGAPTGLMFGPDGNFYVADSGYFGSSPSVLRFQGPAGPTPGAFLDAFVPAGRGGLLQPFGVLFGPDRNGDGRQDLYVTSADLHESSFKTSQPHTSSVKVYDGVTGAYISDFVAEGSGGLDTPILMTFTETDPVTLAYTGGTNAASAASQFTAAGAAGTGLQQLPSGGQGSSSYLLVPDNVNENVLRYDAATGAFVDEFIPRRSGGLNQPNGIVFGPHDHDLYITTGHFQGPGQIKAVLRFDAATGAFEDESVERRQLAQPHSGIFGPDGNLYVGDSGNNPGGNHSEGGRVARFDGRTGAFLGNFVAPGSGGLTHPGSIVFGPDSTGDGQLDLYATDEGPARVMLYDGVTGAFVREFVTSHSGGLSAPWGLTFGPDGNLYVASILTKSVMRFQGPSGPTPGAPLPALGNSGAYFVSTGSGGLLDTLGVLFGPDGNGDGQQDLYVTSSDFYNQGFINSKNGSVKRYDGRTGAFIDTFVAPGSGGLRSTVLITFTETDPVTLTYTGATIAAPPARPGAQAASTSFALAAGNTNPQGIADPPVPLGLEVPESESPPEPLLGDAAPPIDWAALSQAFTEDVFAFKVGRPGTRSRR